MSLADSSRSPVSGAPTQNVNKILQKIDEIALSIKSSPNKCTYLLRFEAEFAKISVFLAALSSQTKRMGRYQSLSLRWDNQHQRNIRAAVETINDIVNVLRQKTGVSDLKVITIEEDASLMRYVFKFEHFGRKNLPNLIFSWRSADVQ
jgi:hypothetical protein